MVKLQFGPSFKYVVLTERCFLAIGGSLNGQKLEGHLYEGDPGTKFAPHFSTRFIHVPGLRADPARRYPVANAAGPFAGRFDSYVASIIARWSGERSDNIYQLATNLRLLDLTNAIKAEYMSDTSVELKVALQWRGSVASRQMVNIADVGLGVSQVLPVLVALLAASPLDTVYLEQPEIHLHPRAQARLALPIVAAVKRGVRVIVETHSSLLLRSLQTEIAKAELNYRDVKFYWFSRPTLQTRVKVAKVDKQGSFGNWPIDFSGVSFDEDNKYINATRKLRKQP
jgi:hypothetical protein